jgi:predicted DNA repair protein MutK
MAAGSLLALLDDIASVLDDVAVLTKAATKKTAGVLGDDLALNAQQVAGVRASRELPVVWAVAKGSAINKAILVPAALAVSALAPWLVTPLLMVGGAFLCYEGFEKIVHKLLHRAEADAHQGELKHAVGDPAVDMVALEKDKIRGAIRTDFILSAEIIVIALGTVAGQSFGVQVAVLVGIAVLMTVGVYGLVAGIVKLDDVGLALSRRPPGGFDNLLRALGRGIVAASPWIMKFLSVAGTVAMFLVGGGILMHGFAYLQHSAEHWADLVGALPGVGALLGPVALMLLNLLAGLVAGAILVAVVGVARKLFSSRGGATAG